MRLIGIAVCLACAGIACAQPGNVVDDLERRALRALGSIARDANWHRVSAASSGIRTRLARSLGPTGVPGSAMLYLPNTSAAQVRVPAVVLLRPHVDPAAMEARRLAAGITSLGFAVIEVDAHQHHTAFDRLAEGVVPQTLMQAAVRSALAYLKNRPDVDTERLALVGEGLAATVAAGLNAEFATAVILNGASDYRTVVAGMRTTADGCDLLPGLLQYAATEELLSLIAPRPMLLLNAETAPTEYVIELYRGAAGPGVLQHRSEREWSDGARRASFAWLARVIMKRPELTGFSEPTEWPEPLKVELAGAAGVAEKKAFSPAMLPELLGQPLGPESLTIALDCGNRNHRINYHSQPELRIPVSALRPGPTGCETSRGTLIAVDDRGRSALQDDPVVVEALRREWMIWMLDPRGIGELKTPVESSLFGVSLLLGENLAWRQAMDILGLLRRLVSSRGSPVILYARGNNMSLAASYIAATVASSELDWMVLQDAPTSLRAMAEVPLYVAPVGGLRWFDISDLLGAAKAKVVLIRDPQEFIQKEW